MLLEAGSGHTAGPLGMADIFALFYFHILNTIRKILHGRTRQISAQQRAHCSGLYATMAYAGYFPVEELKTLRNLVLACRDTRTGIFALC